MGNTFLFTNSVPPKFTEEKLAEVLHYTDLPDNPAYNAFLSDSVIEIHSGAKGVSKSFGQALITIYRLVNEKNFCSIWCRNQYNHISNTLRPTFEKAIDFLKNVHNLDFTPFLKFYSDAIYWTYEDGGAGRCVLFKNFENTQAFQGITLKNNNFRFGELVIDEPIEDPLETKKNEAELLEIYNIQRNKLPLLRANTIERLAAPEGFKIKIKFLYNIFTVNHFLIEDYHNKVINLFNGSSMNANVLDSLIKNFFVQQEDKDFLNIGCIVTMYHKNFIPKKEYSELQRSAAETLKINNYNKYLVMVCGFAFLDEKAKESYFLRPVIFDENGDISKKIKILENEDYLKDKKILAIYDGFDAGLRDKASWVRTLLLETGELYIMDYVEDLKTLINSNVNRNIRLNINTILLKKIILSNEKLIKNFANNFDPVGLDLFNLILTDNDIINEELNFLIDKHNLKMFSTLANRRDTKKIKFGIINRQQWIKNALINGLVIFNEKTKNILFYLAKQFIKPGEEKRDETINKEIYDLINAFEMSASLIFNRQNIIKQDYENRKKEV